MFCNMDDMYCDVCRVLCMMYCQGVMVCVVCVVLCDVWCMLCDVCCVVWYAWYGCVYMVCGV